jgi:hypothetical protein
MSPEWLVCVISELGYNVGDEELRSLRMRTDRSQGGTGGHRSDVVAGCGIYDPRERTGIEMVHWWEVRAKVMGQSNGPLFSTDPADILSHNR